MLGAHRSANPARSILQRTAASAPCAGRRQPPQKVAVSGGHPRLNLIAVDDMTRRQVQSHICSPQHTQTVVEQHGPHSPRVSGTQTGARWWRIPGRTVPPHAAGEQPGAVQVRTRNQQYRRGKNLFRIYPPAKEVQVNLTRMLALLRTSFSMPDGRGNARTFSRSQTGHWSRFDPADAQTQTPPPSGGAQPSNATVGGHHIETHPPPPWIHSGVGSINERVGVAEVPRVPRSVDVTRRLAPAFHPTAAGSGELDGASGSSNAPISRSPASGPTEPQNQRFSFNNHHAEVTADPSGTGQAALG